MTFARTLLALTATSALAGAVVAAETPAPKTKVFEAATVLFWNEGQKLAGFPHMEDQFETHVVSKGRHVHPLPNGKPLPAFTIKVADRNLSVDDYMKAMKTAGLLVIQDGKIRLEKYQYGYSAAGRWTSFSVAKSFTSTLVGAAIKDGYIKSVNDPVTDYIPGLKGSGYDGVTVRQLLTMTSGVKWNEDYADPKSDVAQLFSVTPDPDTDMNVSYMRKLPRESEPGSKWVYKTGETNLIGVLVTSATHKTLAQYLTEKIWKPYGMEQDAVWMTDRRNQDVGGCCLSVSLHDYGRMGMFMIGGAKAHGRSIVPDGWIATATHKQAENGAPGHGYGYQWWTNDDGTYDAMGIFGQMIHIDPARKLVIVMSSAWPRAVGWDLSAARSSLVDAIATAADPSS